MDSQNSIQELTNRKKSIEDTLSSLIEALESHGATMDTPLITSEGFPRADIDITQIRSIRVDIIRQRNDLRQVMNEISNELNKQFESKSKHSSMANGSSVTPKPVAFAIVREVFDSSPAQQAGLVQGHKIVRFGSATVLNHNNLRRVAEITQSEREIEIEVLDRDDKLQTLKLVPNSNWGGRGSLGAHVTVL